MVEFGPNGQVSDPNAASPKPPLNPDRYKAEGKTFDPLEKRYKPMRFALGLYFILSVVYLGALIVEIISLTFYGIDIFRIEGNVGDLVGTGMVYFSFGTTLVYWFCALFVARWTHRAMTNLHVIKSHEVEMSPNWSVGWYFIPIASLFKPFQGMKEIWNGSKRASGQEFAHEGRLGLWWGTWVISSIVSGVASGIYGNTYNSELYNSAVILESISIVAILISIYMLLKVTHQITRAQTQIRDGGVEATFA